MAEVRPIDLPLLASKGLELQKRLTTRPTKSGNGAAQLHDASAVASIPNHLKDARGQQARMLLESLANELNVGIDNRGTKRLRTLEPLALDRVANGIGMDIQFARDGADLPMFGVKITSNLRAGFRTDHERAHLRRGMRGNGSMKRPTRPQTRQRSRKNGC